jgi:hypothetical protein
LGVQERFWELENGFLFLRFCLADPFCEVQSEISGEFRGFDAHYTDRKQRRDGTHVITITGTSGSHVHSTTVNLIVLLRGALTQAFNIGLVQGELQRGRAW